MVQSGTFNILKTPVKVISFGQTPVIRRLAFKSYMAQKSLLSTTMKFNWDNVQYQAMVAGKADMLEVQYEYEKSDGSAFSPLVIMGGLFEKFDAVYTSATTKGEKDVINKIRNSMVAMIADEAKVLIDDVLDNVPTVNSKAELSDVAKKEVMMFCSDADNAAYLLIAYEIGPLFRVLNDRYSQLAMRMMEKEGKQKADGSVLTREQIMRKIGFIQSDLERFQNLEVEVAKKWPAAVPKQWNVVEPHQSMIIGSGLEKAKTYSFNQQLLPCSWLLVKTFAERNILYASFDNFNAPDSKLLRQKLSVKMTKAELENYFVLITQNSYYCDVKGVKIVDAESLFLCHCNLWSKNRAYTLQGKMKMKTRNVPVDLNAVYTTIQGSVKPGKAVNWGTHG